MMKANPGLGFMKSCRLPTWKTYSRNVRAGIGISWSGAIWRKVLNARLRNLEFNLCKRQARQVLSRGVSIDKGS